MRVLIDILHPAHVHVFRNFHAEMTRRGHDLVVTSRDKDRSVELLNQYRIPHVQISAQRTGLRLAGELAGRTRRLLDVVRTFKPDVLTGIMGPSIAIAGALKRIPAVVFYDTEFAVQTNWFVYPLAQSVCTPDCYKGRVRGRHVTYPGYHELAYLHPARFTPDPRRLGPFGVAADEPYSVVRFVAWKAVHDRRERGFSPAQKHEIIERLSRHGKVVVSSESELPANLGKHAVAGPVEDVHHLLAHASIVVGESATMAAEAAVLGVPAVYLATTGRGYIDDLRSYGLAWHYTETEYETALETIEGLWARGSRKAAAAGHARMLADKVDVTSWMVDFFETELRQATPTGAG